MGKITKEKSGITLATLIITILTLSLMLSIVGFVFVNKNNQINVKKANQVKTEIEKAQIIQELKKIILDINNYQASEISANESEDKIAEMIISKYESYDFFNEKKNGGKKYKITYNSYSKTLNIDNNLNVSLEDLMK